MASKALLDTNPNPTEHEIRWWLAGNLCRCTGYDKIIRAVQDGAERINAQK
jgi:carbon-monoxide dehydrogenase small subunit